MRGPVLLERAERPLRAAQERGGQVPPEALGSLAVSAEELREHGVRVIAVVGGGMRGVRGEVARGRGAADLVHVEDSEVAAAADQLAAVEVAVRGDRRHRVRDALLEACEQAAYLPLGGRIDRLQDGRRAAGRLERVLRRALVEPA